MANSPQRGTRGFLLSRPGVVLLGFLAVGGFLLAAEHRAHLASGDWLLIALVAACLLMHFFMHGGHGGHGQPPDERR